jgi:hypothetical protein
MRGLIVVAAVMVAAPARAEIDQNSANFLSLLYTRRIAASAFGVPS